MRTIGGCFFVPLFGLLGSCWPSVHIPPADTLAGVEISLAPPAHPLPEIADHIGRHEATRDSRVAVAMGRLQQAHTDAIERMRHKVGRIVGDFMVMLDDPAFTKTPLHVGGAVAFLEMSSRLREQRRKPINVLVKYGRLAVPGAIGQIDKVSSERAAIEAAIIEQALKDVGDIENSLSEQLWAGLRAFLSEVSSLPMRESGGMRRGAFLESRLAEEQPVTQAVVKVVPAGQYPTTATMLKDMARRWESTDSLIIAKTKTMNVALVEATNRMIEHALKEVARRVRAQQES